MNIGICGIGFMGMIHYLSYRKVRGAKVKAICEKIPERLQGDWRNIKGNFGPQGEITDLKGVATYDDLDKMLADPNLEMIDVCLAPGLHAEAVLKVLKAGKHCFCEKPIALKPSDAVKMVQTAQKAGKMLFIGHVLPFYAEYQFARDAVRSGRFGKLLGGHFNRIISDPVWLQNFYSMETCGGPMLDLHIHDVHFIRCLFGMPQWVQSTGRLRGDVPEFFSTQYLYEDTDLVVTSTSGTIPQQGRPFTHGYEIHFEKATLLFDSFMGRPLTVLTHNGKVEPAKIKALDDTGPFVNELTETVKAVQSGTPSPLLDGELARDALSLCYKEIDAIRKRKPVKAA
ncbi:MAG: Gfo/Idh/MocA family oxidoreductase [Planctomycetaceae bacterium]|jgi:predicted dehydrogenase|nr:Gfo/Idh/MocA family oxidoreductase [Planctomycetaceae bacterium]